MARLWALLLACCCSANGDLVEEAHARSASLRTSMLREWTLPPSGYLATFAGAPIQHVVAVMFLNENKTAVSMANEIMLNLSTTFNSVYEMTVYTRGGRICSLRCSLVSFLHNTRALCL
jgi:hypothetical protein